MSPGIRRNTSIDAITWRGIIHATAQAISFFQPEQHDTDCLEFQTEQPVSMTRLGSASARKALAPECVAACATRLGLWGSTAIRPRNVVVLSTVRHMNPLSRSTYMTDSVPDGGPAVLHLTLLAGQFAICRLPAGSALPEWATQGVFSSVSWTADETSVVCEQTAVPAGVKTDVGWRALKVAGPMDFSLTGILLSIAKPLANAGIGIFAVSTFDTDYVLVKEASLGPAVRALREFGHTVVGPE